MAAADATSLPAFVKAVGSGTTSDAVDELLVSLKIALAEAEEQGTAVNNERARTLYEHAALYSLLKKDNAGFERHFHLAKCAYKDSGAGVKPSNEWNVVNGLYFMHLLVLNRLAEFHAELEVMSSEQLASPYIKFPVTLEQYLAEGRYNKVLDSLSSLPNPVHFQVFVDPLLNAVRGEIADCTAAAYKTLPVQRAQRMFLFDTERELLQYVETAQPTWSVASGVISFNSDAEQRAKVPAEALISNSLGYAVELERIV